MHTQEAPRRDSQPACDRSAESTAAARVSGGRNERLARSPRAPPDQLGGWAPDRRVVATRRGQQGPGLDALDGQRQHGGPSMTLIARFGEAAFDSYPSTAMLAALALVVIADQHQATGIPISQLA